MNEIEFSVVDDELRQVREPRRRSPWILAVLEGSTVKVGLKQTALGGYYKLFAKEGYKLRTRSAGDQTIVWADPVEDIPSLVPKKSK